MMATHKVETEKHADVMITKVCKKNICAKHDLLPSYRFALTRKSAVMEI